MKPTNMTHKKGDLKRIYVCVHLTLTNTYSRYKNFPSHRACVWLSLLVFECTVMNVWYIFEIGLRDGVCLYSIRLNTAKTKTRSFIHFASLWSVSCGHGKNQYLLWSQYTCEYPIRSNSMRRDADDVYLVRRRQTTPREKKIHICLAKRLAS